MALLFGVHENTDPAATVATVGGNASRVFTAGVIGPRDLVATASAACKATWAAGLTAVWSFKPHPGAVASGAWRPYVEDLGAFLHANPGKQTVVVIWHEPENDIPKWFADPAAFVRMFDTVAGWLRSRHPEVVTVHAALAYRYGDGVDITDSVAPAWRTSADVHCIDIYSGRTNPIDWIMPELSSYRRWRQFVARDSPWGITERGWSTGTIGKGGTSEQRAAAMTREAVWLAAQDPPPAICLLWNTAGTEGDQGLVLDAPAMTVARSLMTQQAGLEYARAAAAATTAAEAGTGTPAVPARPAATRTVTCPLCAGSGKYTFPV